MVGHQTGDRSNPGPAAGRTMETVALALEPAGRYTDDEIMVIALCIGNGWRVFTQRCGRDAASLEATIRDRVSKHGSVSLHDSERALLQAATEFLVKQFGADGGAAENSDSHSVILAYDEPHLDAGMLPVLRTRLAAQGLSWPFWGCSYVELRSVIEERFHVQTQDETALGLSAAHELLSDDVRGAGLNAADPADSAAAARAAAANLRTEELIIHTVINAYRVSMVHRILQRYCSLADLQPRDISPAKQAYLEHQA